MLLVVDIGNTNIVLATYHNNEWIGSWRIHSDPKKTGDEYLVIIERMLSDSWIWYPDAREVLNNYTVFNPNNSSSSITFDDLLNARRFSSVIYKAQTMYGITPIEDYIPKNAKGQLEESDRIRESILQSEADMWNY